MLSKSCSSRCQYPDALLGVSEIYRAVSRFKSAANIVNTAFRLAPRDTEIILAHARTAPRPGHEAELKLALAALDPNTRQAASVRAHLSRDAAMKGRKRKLLSEIGSGRIHLVRLLDGPKRLIGVGVEVRFNDRVTVRLKLDSGASGISISPRAAKRAGFEVLTEDGGEVNGLGDKTPERSAAYFAKRIKIGPLEWENVQVATFRAAKESEADGLIGTDVFSSFRVTIDFPGSLLTLEANPQT